MRNLRGSRRACASWIWDWFPLAIRCEHWSWMLLDSSCLGSFVRSGSRDLVLSPFRHLREVASSSMIATEKSYFGGILFPGYSFYVLFLSVSLHVVPLTPRFRIASFFCCNLCSYWSAECIPTTILLFHFMLCPSSLG